MKPYPYKTIRGTQILNFIHYLHGLDYLAKEQSIFNDWYRMHLDLMFDPHYRDKNNPNHDWDSYNTAKKILSDGGTLKINQNSSYNEIVSAVNFVHEQADTLSFISNHLLGILLKNLNRTDYLNKEKKVNMDYFKKYRILMSHSSIYLKLDKRALQHELKKKRYEQSVEIEKTFKDDFFTGKSILSTVQDLGVYIDALLKQTDFSISRFSKNYKRLLKFKLGMYAEVLLDIKSAFVIPDLYIKRAISNEVSSYLENASSSYKNLDFHTKMNEIGSFVKKQNKFQRLFEAAGMCELWSDKVKKHAPLPDVIHYIDIEKFIEEDENHEV
ncbi:hypothetical protein [Mesobacillus campisalis]|nr:hypothetical protein [Mesobacillus campisalis]